MHVPLRCEDGRFRLSFTFSLTPPPKACTQIKCYLISQAHQLFSYISVDADAQIAMVCNKKSALGIYCCLWRHILVSKYCRGTLSRWRLIFQLTSASIAHTMFLGSFNVQHFYGDTGGPRWVFNVHNNSRRQPQPAILHHTNTNAKQKLLKSSNHALVITPSHQHFYLSKKIRSKKEPVSASSVQTFPWNLCHFYNYILSGHFFCCTEEPPQMAS